MKGKILVFLQFFLIALMIYGLKDGLEHIVIGGVTIACGGIIGSVAILQHKRGNFNIRPDIKHHCQLVTDGIYGYVRHPMYLSVLVMLLGVVLLAPSWIMVIEYILLVVVLMKKIHYEEYLWCNHDRIYLEYVKKTKQLIPFIL